ncbi:hypothetical protein BSKO_13392 [Bryopsis sp. KO-2023]|nr:hypothetical protein BSKO_13392 [Bryopsis sp. KO-2023]
MLSDRLCICSSGGGLGLGLSNVSRASSVGAVRTHWKKEFRPFNPPLFKHRHGGISSSTVYQKNDSVLRWRNNAVTASDGGGGSNPPPSTSDENGGGGDEDDDGEEGVHKPELLNLAEAEAIAAEKGVTLPADFKLAAQADGLRAQTLNGFIQLQGLLFIGFLMNGLPWVRDRLIVDPKFLFKILAEVSIDSGCATVAEVRKRGEHFWDEFEFYLSDMVVGIVLDVALVTLLAPVAIVGKFPKCMQETGIKRWLGRLPCAVFEASVPGVREYSVIDRVACYFVKGIEYGVVGMGCGFAGQGVANGCMMLRRHLNGGATESDVPIPPLLQTALVWGLFMGVSSNTRYQAVVGLERLVDVSIAKKVPQLAYVTTIIIRFINNIIGGENFIDMARWAGIQ